MTYDLIIKNGLHFDGLGNPPVKRSIAITDGRIVAIGEHLSGDATNVVEAEGMWVVPGFVDTHTHYDAEVLVAPGLDESVRHGVTTVVMGSCSLSAVYSDPLDVSDLFTRVEALPRDYVLPLLEEHKTWDTPQGFIDHLESLPLGPNVAAFIGHSDMRTSVMGLDRATDANVTPTPSELSELEQMLSDSIDAGFLGLSTMTNPWDKIDGDRCRSRALPSTYAAWSEYSTLAKQLRERGRILQGAPNLTTKYNIFLYLWESLGVRSHPAFAIVEPDSDSVAERFFGPVPDTFIREKIEAALASSAG